MTDPDALLLSRMSADAAAVRTCTAHMNKANWGHTPRADIIPDAQRLILSILASGPMTPEHLTRATGDDYTALRLSVMAQIRRPMIERTGLKYALTPRGRKAL